MASPQGSPSPEKGGQIWPDDFLKGIALSVWQNSGDTKSNWTAYTKKKNYFGQKEHAEAFHKANDFWNM